MEHINLTNPEVIANPPRTMHPFLMYDAIHSIPATMTACLSGDPFAKLVLIANKLVERDIDHVIVVGCGTSYNAARLVSLAFDQMTGMYSRALDAMEFLLYPPPDLNAKTALIAISHSGGSLPTRLAVTFAKSFGSYTICLTGSDTGRLALLTEDIVVDPAGRETPRPKTRSYFITAFQGALLAALIGQQVGRCTLPNLKVLAQLCADLPSQVEIQIKTTANEWSRTVYHYMLAGSGFNSATAFEIALKIMEAIGMPAVGFDLEEFTHGPGYCLGNKSGVVLLQTSLKSLSRCLEAANAVAHTHAKLLIITSSPKSNWPDSAVIIAIPEFEGLFGDFQAIIPAQLLVYYLAVAIDQNPDLAMNDHTEIFALSKTMFPPGTH